MSVFVNIGIVYIMPTIAGVCNFLGVFGPFGPKVGGLCNLNWDLS